MPLFIVRGELEPYTNWIVYYSDIDPAKFVRQVKVSSDRPDLAADSMFGHEAAEIKLTDLLAPGLSRGRT